MVKIPLPDQNGSSSSGELATDSDADGSLEVDKSALQKTQTKMNDSVTLPMIQKPAINFNELITPDQPKLIQVEEVIDTFSSQEFNSSQSVSHDDCPQSQFQK